MVEKNKRESQAKTIETERIKKIKDYLIDIFFFDNDVDLFRVVKEVSNLSPKVKLKICVKMVDVFGSKSFVVEEVG